MTGGNAAERSERSLPTVGGDGAGAGLIARAAAAGVRLEARPGGRLWADRPDLLPPDLRDSLAAHRPGVVALLAEPAAASPGPRMEGCGRVADAPPPAAASLPGVPLGWCEGVTRLATMPTPDSIAPARWAVLAVTSARLLRDHGAALHGAGWGVLDVFGLHHAAPMTHPPAWGLAWLLGERGEVLDIAPDAAGMRREPRGWRLVCVRRTGGPPPGSVPAWKL